MPMTFGAPTRGWPDFGGSRRSPLPRIGKTYLAGPMRGIERFNYPAFDVAQKELEAQGWEVWSPAQMDRDTGHDVEFSDPSVVDAAFMQAAVRRDLKVLLDVDAIHLMMGWQRSSGATWELDVAEKLGLQVWEQRKSGVWYPHHA